MSCFYNREQQMKTLNILIFLSILQFVNVFTNPVHHISLIGVDLSEQINTAQIEKLQLPVVYKLDQVIILKANQDQKKSLKSCGIDFNLLDQDISNNTYHLAKNTILSENAQIMSKAVGKINNYLILKNINRESIKNVSTQTHISQLDITSTQFFFNKNYISKRASADVDPLITKVIEDINRDSVEFFINTLQAYGSRFMLAPNRF